MYYEKWIMLSHWCQQLLYEVLVQYQYRPGEGYWPTLNDDDEIIYDYYDEEYISSPVYEFRVWNCGGKYVLKNDTCWATDGGLCSKTCPSSQFEFQDCRGNVSWKINHIEPSIPTNRLEWQPLRPITTNHLRDLFFFKIYKYSKLLPVRTRSKYEFRILR